MACLRGSARDELPELPIPDLERDVLAKLLRAANGHLAARRLFGLQAKGRGLNAVPLGPLFSEHRARPAVRRLHGIACGLGLGGAALSLALGLVRWYFAFAHYGPSSVWRWSLPFLGVGAALLLLGSNSLVTTWSLGRLRIRVYQGGLMLQRGRRQWTIPWNLITRIHTSSVRYRLPGLTRRSHTELTLYLDSPDLPRLERDPAPSRVRLTHALTDLDLLADSIKRQVYPGLLARYSRSFNQGNSLSFGSLVLTRDGLRKGRQMLRWQDLGNVSLRQGVLALDPAAPGRYPRIRLPARQLPNVELCIQLIQYLSRQP